MSDNVEIGGIGERDTVNTRLNVRETIDALEFGK
jgi:hypothetical protein